jgi:hypothetical protein
LSVPAPAAVGAYSVPAARMSDLTSDTTQVLTISTSDFLKHLIVHKLVHGPSSLVTACHFFNHCYE